MHFDVGNSAKLSKANAAWWGAELAKHDTSREQLQQLLDESKARQKPLARPVWLLEMYSSCSFINRELIKLNHPATMQQQFNEQQPQNQNAINGSVLILWGKQQQLLNQSRDVPSSRGGKSWKLKDPMHQAVQKDLTQDADAHARSAAPVAPAAAAAAFASAPVASSDVAPMEMEEDETVGAMAQPPVVPEARHSLPRDRRKRVVAADDSDGAHSGGEDADEYHPPSDDNDSADEAMDSETRQTRGRKDKGAAAVAVGGSAAKRSRLRN